MHQVRLDANGTDLAAPCRQATGCPIVTFYHRVSHRVLAAVAERLDWLSACTAALGLLWLVFHRAERAPRGAPRARPGGST